jgi:hypothetical protein
MDANWVAPLEIIPVARMAFYSIHATHSRNAVVFAQVGRGIPCFRHDARRLLRCR